MTKELRDDEKQLELVNGNIQESKDKPVYTMSEKALAQRRENAAAMRDDVDRLYFIAEVAKIGQRADTTDPESMLQCFCDYLDLAAERGQRIGNITAYMSMGISKRTAEYWAYGQFGGKDPRFKQLINYVQAVCASYRETLALNNKIHPAMAIFWQRNFDGLTNEDIVRVDVVDPLGEVKDRKQIADKYQDLIEE